ncbi:unnamed protein product, partial [marine sediment metagenome]
MGCILTGIYFIFFIIGTKLNRALFGFYLGFISWLGLLIGVIILIRTKEFGGEQVKWHEVTFYIKRLPLIYKEIEIVEILSNLKIQIKFINKLKLLLEDLIYNKIIDAKIIGAKIVFTTVSTQSPQTPSQSSFMQDFNLPELAHSTTQNKQKSGSIDKKGIEPYRIISFVISIILTTASLVILLSIPSGLELI